MHPPHLPPPSCSIKIHARFQHVPLFLVVLVIALLAGCSAALATIAWIAPQSPSAQLFGPREVGRTAAESPLDPAVASQTKQRLITIYDTTKKVNGSLYSGEARIGYSALLTSDGWAVAYLPSYRGGEEKNWEGIDHQGISHRVLRVSLDSIGRPLYIQFAGGGFRIVPFASAENIASGAPVWTFVNAIWRRAVLDGVSRVGGEKMYPVWRPEYAYRLRGEPVAAGALVFTDGGEFVGLADERNLLIPGWIIEVQIPSILAHGKPIYPSFELDGYFIEAIAGPQAVKSTAGFFLAKVLGKDVQSFARGDVILRIDGDAIDPETASRKILTSSGEVRFTVLHQGQEREIRATIK